jgi:hypothetical protein
MLIDFSLYLKEGYCQENNLKFKTKIKNRKDSLKNKNFLKLESFCFLKNG